MNKNIQELKDNLLKYGAENNRLQYLIFMNKKSITNAIEEAIKKRYFDSLTYTETKEFFDDIDINYKLPMIESHKKSILNKAKIRRYPIMHKAYHFPILNEIKFLSDKQKHELDKIIGNKRVTGIHRQGIEKVFLFSHEDDFDNKINKIIQFLLDNKIFEPVYQIECEKCHWGTKKISKTDYDKYIYYLALSDDEIEKLTDEQYREYEKYQYFTFYCDECDYDLSIDDLEDFKICVTIDSYKRIAEPDYTLDNI